jgi:hypothetical protein
MNPIRSRRQIPFLLTLLVGLSMCDDAEVIPSKKPPKSKEYPTLDSATLIKSLPLFSQWDLACGSCSNNDSLSNFNSLVPEYTGENRYQCGHADAGCVAVAMGQILYYWKKPGIIDWSQLKDTCSTRETAKLMYEVGRSVGMVYNVDQSGSSGISFDQLQQIINAFKVFGFSAEYGAFDLDTAIAEIDSGRPVILIGCSKSFCHAWITTAYGVDNKNGYHLFMNWGTNYNHWSSALEWRAGGTVFDRKKTMVYNIRPV